MRTQEEIVVKAKEYAESIGSKDGTVMYDYVMGYTQCQEDMAKLTFVPGLDKETLDELFDLHDDDDFIHEDSDKKYTDEDLKEAFKQSRQVKIFEKGMPPVWESFEDYINSLNKKD